ncbi:MAG: polysaccharide deacetylase family protein [Bacteroidales bacterium]|nr:polysaccharide deacetylase family protein [Bacteroidales bacterium]
MKNMRTFAFCTKRVIMYPFPLSAINYTLRRLFDIAGLPANEPLPAIFDMERMQVSTELVEGKHVVFHLLDEEKLNHLLQGQLTPAHIKSHDGQSDCPIFYCGQSQNAAILEGGTLHIHADLLSLPFILLSRYEEMICADRDSHGRFPYQRSLACRYQFVEIPIVDEYGLFLRQLLTDFIPSLLITPRQGRVVPTHDVDLLFRFGGFMQNLRTVVGGDLIKAHNLKRALRSWSECRATLRNRCNDPLVQAIEQLCIASKEAGLTSIFHFKALHNGEKDATYDISQPELKHCFDIIKQQGMQRGLHGSYDSYDGGDTLRQEKEALEHACGQPIDCARQHFLRFDVHQSLAAWQTCGIRHDSTLGFAEREGFRCGTCHPYPLYDWQQQQESSIIEHPLIVMDGTLIEYRQMDPPTALAQIRRLHHQCMAVEGDMVILWHNHTTIREFEEYYRKVYLAFLHSL